ncbi:cutinase family protein [Rhodococcus sp. NPDC058521]|uniref:cutinase family protein n=1 Tax=Rhodococcus sp. NPDC058521 TaxID=3346536 RepID=UPI00364E9513
MKRLLALLTSLAAAALVPAVAAPAAQADPGGCPSMYVVAVPGTWETSNGGSPGPGLLSGVTGGLPSSVQTDYVTYSATAFPWETEVYGRSKAQAVNGAKALLKGMADRCASTDLALVGYSQGADAAGDVAAEIGTGLGVVPADRMAAVGLISDPRRSPSDVQIGARVVGAGVGGARIGGFGWISDKVVTICAVGDLYCSTPQDDFVSRFAGFLGQISGTAPGQFGQFQQEAQSIFNDLMAAGGLPTLMSQLDEPSNDERIQKLEQFYGSTVHQDYATYPVDGAGTSATAWMQNWLRGKI